MEGKTDQPRDPVSRRALPILQGLMVAVALAGVIASIRYLDTSQWHWNQFRKANAMRKHGADSAAAREYLLGTWLTSYDPHRSERKDTPAEMARRAAFMWRVAKKSGHWAGLDPIVAARVRGLKSRGVTREEALAHLLDKVPPGYPDEVASDRERLTQLVDKWWGPQVDEWWEKERARFEKERHERRLKEQEQLEEFLASDRATTHAKVAIEFASALVEKDYARAEALLTPALRQKLTREVLRAELYGMFRGYSQSEPRSIHFDEQGQLKEWPGKQRGDIGWAYVSIEGDDFVEAVNVVVSAVGDKHLIREVNWGRP